MQDLLATPFRIGAWRVDPVSGQISRDGESARLEERAMRLLLCLAGHGGEVVSIDDLLQHVWSGVSVAPDSVYQAVASVRRVLGDDPKHPTYIETVPRLGYRLIATVSSCEDQPLGSSGTDVGMEDSNGPLPGKDLTVPRKASRNGLILAVGALICIALVIAFILHGKEVDSNRSGSGAADRQTATTIAVLPFLDLTEGMTKEEFADGMTEELIDSLSKIPGLRVPSPTSSFFFKRKQLPIPEIAKALGVVYILDGSVRKSGSRVRVAVRLIRADNGYVIWSETYDRPLDDIHILIVQDDIADAVTKGLRASVTSRPQDDKSR